MPCIKCMTFWNRCNSDDVDNQCKSNFHMYHKSHTYCPTCSRWVLNAVRPEHSEILHKWKTYCAQCKRWESPKTIHNEHTDEKSRYNAADKKNNSTVQIHYDEHIQGVHHRREEPCRYCNPKKRQKYLRQIPYKKI